jgi:hypothetical protein
METKTVTTTANREEQRSCVKLQTAMVIKGIQISSWSIPRVRTHCFPSIEALAGFPEPLGTGPVRPVPGGTGAVRFPAPNRAYNFLCPPNRLVHRFTSRFFWFVGTGVGTVWGTLYWRNNSKDMLSINLKRVYI